MAVAAGAPAPRQRTVEEHRARSAVPPGTVPRAGTAGALRATGGPHTARISATGTAPGTRGGPLSARGSAGVVRCSPGAASTGFSGGTDAGPRPSEFGTWQ